MPTSPDGIDLWPFAPELKPFLSGISAILRARAGNSDSLNIVLWELTATLDAMGSVSADRLPAIIRMFLKKRFPMQSAPPLGGLPENNPSVQRVCAHLESSPAPAAEALCMYYLDGSGHQKITSATGVTDDELRKLRKNLAIECSGALIEGANAPLLYAPASPLTRRPLQRILSAFGEI